MVDVKGVGVERRRTLIRVNRLVYRSFLFLTNLDSEFTRLKRALAHVH